MADISTPGKPVSVTPGKATPLPAAMSASKGTWGMGAKPPGAGAGFAPGPPQLPTQVPPPRPVAQAATPKPQEGPAHPPIQKPPPGPFSTGGTAPAQGGGSFSVGGFKVPGMQELGGMIDKAKNPGYDDMSKMTSTVPPLSMLTPRLGSMQGPADSVLQAIQSAVKNDPARFAGLAGGLAPGLTSGILSAGPMGMAALPGLYGLLGGGESFAAANQFFKPLLPRLGLG